MAPAKPTVVVTLACGILLSIATAAEAQHVISSRSFVVPSANSVYFTRIIPLPDSSVVATARDPAGTFFVRLDRDLAIVSSATLSFGFSFNAVAALDASTNVLVAHEQTIDLDPSEIQILQKRFVVEKILPGYVRQSSSVVVFSTVLPAGQFGTSDMHQRDILLHPNGSLYSVGQVASSSTALDCWIGRHGPDLNLLSSAAIPAVFPQTNPPSGYCSYSGITVMSNGDLAVSGDVGAQSYPNAATVTRFSPSLVLMASTTVNLVPASGPMERSVDIKKDRFGNLWVVGVSSGAWSYASSECEAYGSMFWVAKFLPSLELAAIDVDSLKFGIRDLPYAILYDSEDKVWTVSETVGCSPLAGARWVRIHDQNGVLVSSRVFPIEGVRTYTLEETPDGVIWAGGSAENPSGTRPIFRLGLQPRIVSEISATVSGTSSATWNWGLPSRFNADYYRVLSSPGDVLLATTAVRQFARSGAPGNTQLGVRVAPVNASGEGPLTAGVTVYTLAAPPENPTLAAASAEALTVSWSTAGNSAATPYSVYLSTGASPATNGFSGNRVSSVTASSASLAGLLPGTTYFVALKATNGDGVDTALVSAGSARTASLATGVLSGAALGVSSVSWSWADVTGESGYRIVDGAGASLAGNLAPGTTGWVETGLSTNTSYSRRLVAFGGAETSTSAAVAVFTQAAPPLALAFDAVYTSSFAVSWATNTNPAGTPYRLYVWEAVAGTSTLTTTASSAAVTGLVGGATYFVTLEALNGDSVVTRGPPAASTATVPGGSAAAGSVILIQLPSGQATVDVPSSAFPPGVTVTVEPPGPLPAASGGTGMAGTGVGVRITASGSAQPQQRVAIGLPYRDADVAGLDTSRLLLARYDEARRVWVPLDSRVDTAAKRVTGTTDHFSLFQVMQAGVASGLDAPRVFPNPLRPSLGHTGMTFDTLPAGARVRVYTLLGELVRDLTASGAGLAFWDGKNASGALVASGVYAVFIQGDGQSKTLKVAVQR